jgi:hypothetical protein
MFTERYMLSQGESFFHFYPQKPLPYKMKHSYPPAITFMNLSAINSLYREQLGLLGIETCVHVYHTKDRTEKFTRCDKELTYDKNGFLTRLCERHLKYAYEDGIEKNCFNPLRLQAKGTLTINNFNHYIDRVCAYCGVGVCEPGHKTCCTRHSVYLRSSRTLMPRIRNSIQITAPRHTPSTYIDLDRPEGSTQGLASTEIARTESTSLNELTRIYPDVCRVVGKETTDEFINLTIFIMRQVYRDKLQQTRELE